MLDTRDAEDFAQGFIPNSINIGLDGNFAQWVGEMIADVKQKILLITYPGKEEESVILLARVGYDYSLGYLKGGFDAWQKAQKQVDTVQRLSPRAFKDLYASQPTIIDVRKASEFEAEHLIGASNISLNQINEHMQDFPKETPFYLYCAGGYRSMIAAAILKQRGWDNFADVVGGFKAIKESLLPTTTYKEPTTLL